MDRQDQDAGADARGFLQNLNELIRQAVAQAVPPLPEEPRVRMKVPTFDGKGDIELFIQQFEGVALAQQWDEGISVLKIREGLTGDAMVCGRANTYAEIVASLRLHFSMTATEAEAKLSAFKRNPNRPLAEYSAEVQRLVHIAYADADEPVRDRIAMEKFKLGLNHPGLQGHLLAVRPDTLDELVQASNEYLRVTKTNGPLPPSRVREVNDDEEPDAEVAEVASPANGESKVLKAIEALTAQIGVLVKCTQQSKATGPTGQPKSGDRRPRQTSRPTECWGCKGEGHLRRDCPTNPWQPAGNAASPRQ